VWWNGLNPCVSEQDTLAESCGHSNESLNSTAMVTNHGKLWTSFEMKIGSHNTTWLPSCLSKSHIWSDPFATAHMTMCKWKLTKDGLKSTWNHRNYLNILQKRLKKTEPCWKFSSNNGTTLSGHKQNKDILHSHSKNKKTKQTPWPLVCKRPIPTDDRHLLVKVSANFCR
jgi:hypothetical protein